MTSTDEGAPSFDDTFAALFRHAYAVAHRILGSQPDAEPVVDAASPEERIRATDRPG